MEAPAILIKATSSCSAKGLCRADSSCLSHADLTQVACHICRGTVPISAYCISTLFLVCPCMLQQGSGASLPAINHACSCCLWNFIPTTTPSTEHFCKVSPCLPSILLLTRGCTAGQYSVILPIAPNIEGIIQPLLSWWQESGAGCAGASFQHHW